MIKRLTFEEARQRAEELLLEHPLKQAERQFGIDLLNRGIPILDPRYIEIDGNYMFFVNEEFGLEEYNKKGALLGGSYMYLRTKRESHREGDAGSGRYDMEANRKHLQMMIDMVASGEDRLD